MRDRRGVGRPELVRRSQSSSDRSSRRPRGARWAPRLVGRRIGGTGCRAGGASAAVGETACRRCRGTDRCRLSATSSPTSRRPLRPKCHRHRAGRGDRGRLHRHPGVVLARGRPSLAAVQDGRIAVASARLGAARSAAGSAGRLCEHGFRPAATPASAGTGGTSRRPQRARADRRCHGDRRRHPQRQHGRHRCSGGGPQGNSHRAGVLCKHVGAWTVR